MKIPHDKFCVLPWISLETSPIGTVRPCCLADDELVDDQGNKFDLRTASFSEIQNSHSMIMLREQFLRGQQPQTCRKCWHEERAGRTSKRMHTLDRLKHVIHDQEWTRDAKPLLFLDLKLGNICNLKCRICGSWSSSTFATEELKFIDQREDRKRNHHYVMLQAGAWPRQADKFWQEIDQVTDQIRYIEFTGGEPFMIQEHFGLLQGLVDRGLAGQVEIHYNTNGTQWPQQAEQIWRHFKLVEIAFSIDDLGDRFEYQRTGAVWTEVCDNLKRFQNLRDQHSNIQLQICCTVNVFNVLYLPEVAAWLKQHDFDFVYWNIMHDAYYFSIATLPDTAKQVIAERLDRANTDADTQEQFSRIKDFMLAGNSLDGDILRMRVADLDRRRGQNLADVAPELAKIINYDPSR